MPSRIVEVLLRAAALFSMLAALLWALGPYGAGLVSPGDLGWVYVEVLSPLGLAGWAAGPITGALLTSRADNERLFSLVDDLNGYGETGYTGPPHLGDILVGTRAQFTDAPAAQGLAFISLTVAGLVAAAWIWWMLATLVSESRAESPFTLRNARRIGAIGWVVLVGGIAISVGHWLVMLWLLETSSIADRVDAPGYGWTSVPWWSVGVGAALIILADVWRRGVRMAADLQGLV